MLPFCRARRNPLGSTPAIPSPLQTAQGHRSDIASHSQAVGMASLASISTARRTVSLPSISGSSTASVTAFAPPLPPPTTALTTCSADSTDTSDTDRAVQEQQELAYGQKMVEKELARWVLDPLWPKSKPLNLIRFWDVSLVASLCN